MKELEFLIEDGVLKKYVGKSKKVVIPNGVTEIAERAFSNLEIKSVLIPGSVRKIGKEAFRSCMKLNSVDMENGVTEIGDDAFNLCCKLKSLVFPESVKKIGYTPWNCCESLKKLIFLGSLDDPNPEGFRATGCSLLLTVVLPEGLTEILPRAFSASELLASVVIPSSVKKIGEGAFEKAVYGLKLLYTGSATEWQTVEKGKNCLPPKKLSIYTDYQYKHKK